MMSCRFGLPDAPAWWLLCSQSHPGHLETVLVMLRLLLLKPVHARWWLLALRLFRREELTLAEYFMFAAPLQAQLSGKRAFA